MEDQMEKLNQAVCDMRAAATTFLLLLDDRKDLNCKDPDLAIIVKQMLLECDILIMKTRPV